MTLSCSSATKIENGSGNSASGSVAYTAGHALITGLGAYGGATWTASNYTVSDSVNGSHTQRTNDTQTGGNNQFGTSFFEKLNASGTSATVTVSSGTGGLAVVATVHEVASTLSAIGFDAGTGGHSTNPTTNPVTPALSLLSNSEILFACLANTSGGNPATLTVNSTGSTGGTWALKSSTQSQETNGSAIQTESMPFLVVSTNATSPAHGWTTDNSVASYIIAAWREPAAVTKSLSWSVSPSFAVAEQSGFTRALSFAVTPAFSLARVLGALRSPSWATAWSGAIARALTNTRALAWSIAPGFTVQVLKNGLPIASGIINQLRMRMRPDHDADPGGWLNL